MARGNMTESVSRTERRKQATRLNLLAAAEQQIATVGLNQVSIQTTTHLADVLLGTFYNHFESKDVLIDELLARDERRIDAAATALQSAASSALHEAAAYPSAIAWRAVLEPGWARLAGELWATGRWPTASVRDWGLYRQLSEGHPSVPEALELRVLAVRDVIGGIVRHYAVSSDALGDEVFIEHVVDSAMRLLAVNDAYRIDAVAWALAHPVDLEVFQHVG